MENVKTLSFVEHLVELRKRLVIAVMAIVIGMGIAWSFSNDLLTFIEKPLTGRTYLSEVKVWAYQQVKSHYPTVYSRYQLEKVSAVVVRERKLNYSAPLEPFFVQCKISVIAGFILALPVVFYQLWRFIAPGLTGKEKRYVVPFVTVSSISFCIGALFFLLIIWPVIINFSLSYEDVAGLQSWFNLSAYVNFCLRLILLFGLIFELPVLALLLARLGFISGKFLAGKRRYALLASAIIAAFHADLVTMFVIMIPLYLMYEISIWVAYIFARKRPLAAPVQA
jgi:sec-independent protein translocase protein TatC